MNVKKVVLNGVVALAGLFVVLSLVMPYISESGASLSAFQTFKLFNLASSSEMPGGVILFKILLFVILALGIALIITGTLRALSGIVKPLEKTGGKTFGLVQIVLTIVAFVATLLFLIAPGMELGSARGAGLFVGFIFSIIAVAAAIADKVLNKDAA